MSAEERAWKVYQAGTVTTKEAFAEVMDRAMKTRKEALAQAEKNRKEAMAPADEAYEEAKAQADKAYEEAICWTSAYETTLFQKIRQAELLHRVKAVHRAEKNRDVVLRQAYKAYDEAEEAAEKAYREDAAPAYRVEQKARDNLKKHFKEVTDQAEKDEAEGRGERRVRRVRR